MDILKDRQFKTYDYVSRYSSFPFYYNTQDRKYVYGTTSQLNQDITYILYEVKARDTLDSIALDYYNNPTFFWIIADFNQIQDPYTELVEGTQIKIPTLSEVSFETD